MGFFKKIISGVFEAQAELINWQNAVMENKSDKLYTNVRQLEVATVQIVSDSIRIFDDSSNIVNSTTNPDTFFSRLDLAKEHLVRLKSIEPYISKVKDITINQSMAELYDEFTKNEDTYIESFLYRSLQAVSEKADGMKTEKGKGNQYKKYYESIQPFSHKLNAAHHQIVTEACEKYL